MDHVLYETESILTWEEYKKFSKVVQKNAQNKKLRYICSVIIVAGSVFLIWAHMYLPVILAVLILVVGFSSAFILQKRAVKRSWDSNKMMQNSKHRYLFYEDYLEEIIDEGTVKVSYDKIHKIIITDTNIYILTGINQGLPLLREESSEELVAFIASIKEKYKL